MKILLSLMLALSTAFVSNSHPRTIMLGNLQPNQRVEVDWKFRGCFSSSHYKLTFSSINQRLQVELKEMDYSGESEIKQSIIPVTRKNLSEWDEALSAYRFADPSKSPTCTTTEEVVVTLYEDGEERAKDVLENKSCLSTKIWSMVDTLKEKSNFKQGFD